MSTATKPAPGSALRIRSWRYRMAEHDLRQRVEVSDDGRTLATAEVTTPPGSGGTARVSLHAEPGHITPGCRVSLVDAVLDLPEVQESARVEAAFRLGDSESLLRLQQRCPGGSTRPAGWSTLFSADLPFRPRGPHVPGAPAASLWAHNACMRPLRPPQGVLTDGVISLRVPSVGGCRCLCQLRRRARRRPGRGMAAVALCRHVQGALPVDGRRLAGRVGGPGLGLHGGRLGLPGGRARRDRRGRARRSAEREQPPRRSPGPRGRAARYPSAAAARASKWPVARRSRSWGPGAIGPEISSNDDAEDPGPCSR